MPPVDEEVVINYLELLLYPIRIVYIYEHYLTHR
ncbi:hypothetical protein DFR64_0395 [Pelolinea submarina]|uniref:Uncharacterized protein n=1 Tax=Pelolinea submarina TaxID=913107 RepID=A0A3E0AFS9_9CHLR|nr:hypothetical protein DFR64_0395 [Pelolinea submarina]